MKKLILACSLLTGLSSVALAQPNSANLPKAQQQKKELSPEERAKKSAERAEKELGLSANQRSQWEAASLKMSNAEKPLREKMKGSTTPKERMDLRKTMMSNRKAFDADVDAFLTPDQKSKRAELKAKRKSDHHKKAKHHDAKPADQH